MRASLRVPIVLATLAPWVAGGGCGGDSPTRPPDSPDTTPPRTIADLRVDGASGESITLSWTAPGDDGDAGRAASYDVRFAAQAITESGWDTATPVASPPVPGPAGTRETLVVSDLLAGSWSFAVRARDEAGNRAPLSNVPAGTLTAAITTWAGNGQAAFDGDGRPLRESSFYWPIDLTVTPAGDTYILDWNNHRVRLVTPDGRLRTVIGNDFVGDGPYDQSDTRPPGAAGADVTLNHPTHLLPLPDGRLLLSSWHNHKLRLYDPASGLVLVTCGSSPGFEGDGGPAQTAKLNQPDQTALGPDGSIYVLDQRNQRVRRIAPDGSISTAVGTGTAGYGGDGGAPEAAQLNFPAGGNPPAAGGLAFDAQGRLYISDTLNHRVRRVDFGAARIETVAGNGAAGFSGDGGPATSASLDNPRDIVIGPDGRLYIADELNHCVRAVDLEGGRIDTVAGTGSQAGFAGDGGDPRAARLDRPTGLEFDLRGRLYVVDSYNHRIRRLNSSATP